jgi:hypothetical protein
MIEDVLFCFLRMVLSNDDDNDDDPTNLAADAVSTAQELRRFAVRFDSCDDDADDDDGNTSPQCFGLWCTSFKCHETNG